MVDGPAADAAQAAGEPTVENLSLTSANLLDGAWIFSMGWPGCFSTAAGEKSSWSRWFSPKSSRFNCGETKWGLTLRSSAYTFDILRVYHAWFIISIIDIRFIFKRKRGHFFKEEEISQNSRYFAFIRKQRPNKISKIGYDAILHIFPALFVQCGSAFY